MLKLVVLSCVLAAACASGLIAPQPYNYRGPFFLAHGQPAGILGADGRPLDTLDVYLARSDHNEAKALDLSAHLTAKALDLSAHNTAKAIDRGYHLLKKRSVIAPFSPILYSAPLYQPYNYRGPLSLAPGQPANILGSDGRPLDTLEVNLDRSAHLTAKALNGGIHLLKKRSASLIAPVFGTRLALAPTPLITPAVPIARLSPYAHYSTPLYTRW